MNANAREWNSPENPDSLLILEKAVGTAKYAKYTKGQRLTDSDLRTFRVKLSGWGNGQPVLYFRVVCVFRGSTQLPVLGFSF
jgi:hypothetical protein